MIRAFVFDIGNVLLRFDFSLAHQQLLPLCAVPPTEECLAQVETLKVAYEAGAMDRAAFLKRAFEIIQFRGTEAQFIKAWEEIFELNLPMTGLVESLHGRYPLYLLSNTSDIHVDYFTKEYPLFSRFDDAVYSYKVRCAKPERVIYELAAKQFGIKPEETVFIDDLPANIASAREVGYQAIQYDFRCHELLLEELARLGVE